MGGKNTILQGMKLRDQVFKIEAWGYLHNMAGPEIKKCYAGLGFQNDSVSVKKQETLKCSFNFLLI